MQELPQIGELMDRASSGDDDAFACLARHVQDPLYRFTLAHLLNAADAAETVQETLLRAYRGRRGWRKGSDPWAWLNGIAINVVREWRRKRRRLGVDLDLGGEDERRTDVPDPAPEAAPHERLERVEDLGRLVGAIEQLPPRQREALICRHLRQMSVKETAQAMGCAEGTVKAAVAAAMEALRKMVGL